MPEHAASASGSPAGNPNAARGSVVERRFNPKDAICLRLKGFTRQNRNHADVANALKRADKGADIVARFLNLALDLTNGPRYVGRKESVELSGPIAGDFSDPLIDRGERRKHER